MIRWPALPLSTIPGFVTLDNEGDDDVTLGTQGGGRSGSDVYATRDPINGCGYGNGQFWAVGQPGFNCDTVCQDLNGTCILPDAAGMRAECVSAAVNHFSDFLTGVLPQVTTTRGAPASCANSNGYQMHMHLAPAYGPGGCLVVPDGGQGQVMASPWWTYWLRWMSTYNGRTREQANSQYFSGAAASVSRFCACQEDSPPSPPGTPAITPAPTTEYELHTQLIVPANKQYFTGSCPGGDINQSWILGRPYQSCGKACLEVGRNCVPLNRTKAANEACVVDAVSYFHMVTGMGYSSTTPCTDVKIGDWPRVKVEYASAYNTTSPFESATCTKMHENFTTWNVPFPCIDNSCGPSECSTAQTNINDYHLCACDV